MLEFKPFEITFIDPEPERTTFTETFIWEPTTPGESRLGRLYLVGQILSSNEREINAAKLLELANLIKSEYYRNPNRAALTSFRFALGKVNAALTRHQFKINIAVAAITENTLIAACLGDGTTLVLRNGSCTDLKTKTGTAFATIAHGHIEPGDTVILTTPQLYRLGAEHLAELIGTKKLAKFLKENETEFKNLGCVAVSCLKRGLKPTTSSPIVTQAFATAKPNFNHLKRRLVQATVLGVVVALTIGALAFERNLDRRKLEASEILASIARLEEQTLELLKIGNFAEAERLWGEWQLAVDQLEELEVRNKETTEARNRLDSIQPQVLRYEIVTPREILDFRNNAVGFLPLGLTSLKDGLVIFNEQSLYNFNLRTKSGEFTFLTGGLLIRDVLPHPTLEDSFFMLNTSTSSDAVLEYGRQELRTLATLRPGVGLHLAFYNDAVYLLEKNDVRVLHQAELVPWLKTNFTIENAKDFAIDGFIYVLQESRILKFLNGEKRGEFKVDSGSERIVTRPQFRRLYLLNPSDGTIIIMEKSSLSASRRLQHESLKEARAMAVSEDEKTLYFLRGEKVYSISL